MPRIPKRGFNMNALAAIAFLAASLVVSSILIASEAFAEQLPTEALINTMRSLRGALIKVEVVNGKPIIRVFNAVVGEPAQCFIFYTSFTLKSLDKQGYQYSDFGVTGPGAGSTISDCFEQPVVIPTLPVSER